MRVLVTGGTGFLGAHVVRGLLRRGHEVRCLVRPSSSTRALDGLSVERVISPEWGTPEPRELLRGCDAIQHVAGTFDPSPAGPERMRAIHVDATRDLIDAARELGVEHMVYCSSSITVGWGPKGAPGDEDTPTLDPVEVYGAGSVLRAYHDTKLEGEALVRRASTQGLNGVIVNPDYVIGPWDARPTSCALVLAMARRWIPFYPRGGKCFIDAADCGLGHVLAMERGQGGRRYLLGVHNLYYREFMSMVARAAGRPPPLLPVPRTVTRAMGLMGLVAARIAPHQAVPLDSSVLESMQAERFRSGSRAREELGLPVSPMEESIRGALEWFEEHGYLAR